MMTQVNVQRVVLMGLLFAGGGHVAAESPSRNHDIVPEDYFTLATITSVALSPDGGTVAYTESRWDKEADGRTTELWILDVRTKEATRLTFNSTNESRLHWSPDGRYIYFTANPKRTGEDGPPYDGKRQVWRMTPDGQPMQAVTRVTDGVGSYRLSDRGTAIYYLASEEDVAEEWKNLRKEFKDLQYAHGVNEFSQIWKLDLKTWRSEKLIDEKRVIRSFEVAPDESKIAMITTPDGDLMTNEGWSRVDVYDAATREVTPVTPDGWRDDDPSPFGWLDSMSFSGDSDALAFTISFDGFPTQLYVTQWSGETPELRELKRPGGDITITGGSVRWRGDRRELCFRGEDHARARLYCLGGVDGAGQGSVEVLTPGNVVLGAFGFSRDGASLCVVNNTRNNAGDLYNVHNGRLLRLTEVNPQMSTWKLPQISTVTWKAPDGQEVEGILELPPDYKEGDGPLPMVVEIHGGPTAASFYRFRLWIYGRATMAAQGYALLSPNYRGSTGYGDKFMVDLVGRENDIEVQDILAGVDAMVARGIADPDKLAVMGWSNGGFLTNCLITTTTRFKAASSGAGVLDQIIQWGTEDTPGHVVNFMQGLPWDKAAAYHKGSPMYNLHKVTTPTLIHVGEHDPRVPPAHARSLYRALRRYLHVPTELIVYPGAGHGLATYKHRLAKIKWDLAWFAKYLAPPKTEEPKEDKPDDGET